MSLWLEQALTISLFGIIQLAVLGNHLNGESTSGFMPENWGHVFIPTYIGIGFYILYILARLIYALSGCCNASPQPRSSNDDDDGEDSEFVGGSNIRVSRLRSGSTNSTAHRSSFTNADDVGVLVITKQVEPKLPHEQRSQMVIDCIIDFVFIGLLLATVIVLAHTLDQPSVERDYTAFFVLVYILLGLYILLLIIGAFQTRIIDQSPAGIASGKATLFGGMFVCCRGMQNELIDEADQSSLDNNGSALARQTRYECRAEFQDRPCVYICAPYAIGSFYDYFLAWFLWLVPVALLISTILLQKYLKQQQELTEPIASGESSSSSLDDVTEVPSLEVQSVRPFLGRLHHIAGFQQRVNLPMLDAAAVTTAIELGTALTFSQVLAPMFIVIGILLIGSIGLCIQCCRRQRTPVEWVIGSLYVLWLAFWLWFFIALAIRVDLGPSDEDLADPEGENFHDLFVPLYILFVLTLLIGAYAYICLPASYKPRRMYESKWGVSVARK